MQRVDRETHGPTATTITRPGASERRRRAARDPASGASRPWELTNSFSPAGQGVAPPVVCKVIFQTPAPRLPAPGPDRRDHNRAERFHLRNGVREITANPRTRGCGHPGAREDGSVVLRVSEGPAGRVAGLGGLAYCGSVWSCPWCAVKIAAERAATLERVLAHHVGTLGRWLTLETFTMRHGPQHSLRLCREAARSGWQSVNGGKRSTAERVDNEFRGYCRAQEVTESADHGWHVHFHVLTVWEHRPPDDVFDDRWERWSAGVVRAGLPAPLAEHGYDVKHCDPSDAPETLTEMTATWGAYIVKGLSTEATMGAIKQAKGNNRTIRELMAAAVGLPFEDPETGAMAVLADDRARTRLNEYDRAMRGARQLTWSTGDHDLRTGVPELPDERTDEEIAADDLGGDEVAVIANREFRRLEPLFPDLLSVAEREGPRAAQVWLTDRDVEWWHPNGLTDQRRHGEPPGGWPSRHVDQMPDG